MPNIGWSELEVWEFNYPTTNTPTCPEPMRIEITEVEDLSILDENGILIDPSEYVYFTPGCV